LTCFFLLVFVFPSSGGFKRRKLYFSSWHAGLCTEIRHTLLPTYTIAQLPALSDQIQGQGMKHCYAILLFDAKLCVCDHATHSSQHNC